MKRNFSQRRRVHRVFIFFFLCVSVFSVRNLYAQHLLPRQVYVGDRASLVIPLSSTVTTPINKTTDLPEHKYIDFHKVSLLHDRLIIEFTAWAPGELQLPLIEIGGHYFTDLKINISSLIDRKEPITLSSPASSLAMPGTALMVYGFIALIVFILITAIWFFTKGKKWLAIWRAKWNRWRLFTNMRYAERRYYRAVQRKVDPRIILNKLSQEFRNFLSILTEQNCRAMTAREIDNDIIIRCDDFRFSGATVRQDEILRLLADLHNWVGTVESAEKEAKI